MFPDGTNVEFVEVETPRTLRILIWERGVGPTTSSGTGSCAALVAAAAFGGAERDAEVIAPGGTQRVEWTDDGVYLTGWAEVICEGTWLRQIPAYFLQLDVRAKTDNDRVGAARRRAEYSQVHLCAGICIDSKELTAATLTAAHMQAVVMKDLSPDDRPREKLLRHGTAALGDNELVALVLGSGCRRAGALRWPTSCCDARGGLHGLARSTCERSGAGRRASVRRRRRRSSPRWNWDAGRSRTHRARASSCERRATRQRICCRHSDRGRSSSSASCCSTPSTGCCAPRWWRSGTLNATVVEPRDVFREAMLGAAAAVVVFHNHPSGDPSPSPDDVELTRRLAAAGALMGIDVVDHIVLGDARYCSFKEMGRSARCRAFCISTASPASPATWCSARFSMPGCRSTS